MDLAGPAERNPDAWPKVFANFLWLAWLKLYRRFPPLLWLLWATLILVNGLWLWLDQRPFAWDESIHFMGAAGYHHALRHPGSHLFHALLYQSDFYPPLHEFITGIVFLLTGPAPKVAAFLNVFYLAATAWVLAAIGREFKFAEEGILAGFLLAAASTVAIQSKLFMLDIPLMLFVSLAAWCYLRSEGFTRRRWVAGYGLMLGLALLIKWSALFFLGLPPLAAALTATWRRDSPARSVWLNVLLAFGVAGILTCPWYFAHILRLAHTIPKYIYTQGVLEDDPALSSPTSWFYYLVAVFRQMSWPLALLALGGLAWLIAAQRYRWFWFVWLGLPYLCLTWIRNKDDRYTIPLLPFFCLAAVAWLARVPEPKRRWLSRTILVLAITQIVYVHFGGYLRPLRTWLSHPLFGITLVESQPPDAARWPVAEILRDVQALAPEISTQPVLRVIPAYATFDRVTFAVGQVLQKSKNIHLAGCTDWPAFTDFVLTKSGSQGLPFVEPQRELISRELAASQTAANRRFELVKTYPLPDHSQAFLYRRRTLFDNGPSGKILDELHLRLETILQRYVRDAEDLTLEIIPISPAKTLEGKFRSVRIQAKSARVGDFQNKPLGMAVQNLDLEFFGLVLDLEQARAGKLLPYALSEIRLNHIQIDAREINRALAESGRAAHRLNADFQDRTLRVHWAGKPSATVELGLATEADRENHDSDNLYFRLQALTLSHVWLPGWLLQPLLEDFNPLLRLDGLPSRVELGRMSIRAGLLELGTKVGF